MFLLSDLQHIEQDERVSTGLNGDLYFSHAVEKDSRRDYCCFAAFPRIRTIVQKTAMSVIVKTSRWLADCLIFNQAFFFVQANMIYTLIFFISLQSQRRFKSHPNVTLSDLVACFFSFSFFVFIFPCFIPIVFMFNVSPFCALMCHPPSMSGEGDRSESGKFEKGMSQQL